MTVSTENSVSMEQLIEGLTRDAAYPHPTAGEVEVHETHISVVFLAGDFAYKIKKPLRTDFLDYSTLELRKQFCEKELALDSRYASDLYLGVESIGWERGQLCLGTSAPPVEYAVKMRRFAKGSLLSERIETGELTTSDLKQLAKTIAYFHCGATKCEASFASGWTDYLVKNFHQIATQLKDNTDSQTASTLAELHDWSDDYFKQHLQVFGSRVADGFIRECHGDLHSENIVFWDGRLVPFDGIEFNERLRWIDVLSDVGFLQMDLAARGHQDLSHTVINTYLEETGDYQSLVILRWFLVYRSLVRSWVATMRSKQSGLSSSERHASIADARQHISLAQKFTMDSRPQLWITHGVSGSGKTTLSESVVQKHSAFRLRSDLERKRLFGLSETQRPSEQLQAEMYSDTADERTYERLASLAKDIVRAGYSVIVDATFLRRNDRQRFLKLASQEHVPFAILDCRADPQTLRDRIANRMALNNDASDADLRVLEDQLVSRQPLSGNELDYLADVPDAIKIADHL
ncbi:Zeta toxin [Rubripirellula amarantea]|uniref:Zeta toxin n=1 Tax=Rubripirellula amarantea TaxID=2527999 RepID=A0A5C5WGE2_9BACT|nr:bifunctional aminoglycoside phosphotransferase/ATP-binding protein [Rubripirellula amarantea]TWT49607.1 Zeta toxin [Rubripirellula amarantea]